MHTRAGTLLVSGVFLSAPAPGLKEKTLHKPYKLFINTVMVVRRLAWISY